MSKKRWENKILGTFLILILRVTRSRKEKNLKRIICSLGIRVEDILVRIFSKKCSYSPPLVAYILTLS